ncbi:MAG: hypothetical protein ACFB6R_14510 [Alphaproteobacteria bacterium]
MSGLDIAARGAGTIVDLVGTEVRKNTIRDAARFSATERRRNAADLSRLGQVEADAALRRGRREAGTRRAGLSAGGVDLGSATALALQAEGAADTRFQADSVRRRREAQAVAQENAARLGAFNADVRRRGLTFDQVGTLLGVAGRSMRGGGPIGGGGALAAQGVRLSGGSDF